MKKLLILLPTIILFKGCIGTDVVDDLVPQRIEITNPLISLKIGENYTLMHRYLNNVGMEEMANVAWSSSNTDAIVIDGNGQITALQFGVSEITATLVGNNQVMEKLTIAAAEETIILTSDTKTGKINSTSSYELTGDFTIRNIDSGVNISIEDNYQASSALPGLFVYLSNNPNTVNGALEIGAVTVFSGSHSYVVEGDGLDVDSYSYLLYFCKPFNVKVGHGEIQD